MKSGCRMIRQVYLSVCVGFLYTVVRSSLLSRLTKQSRKGIFPFPSISLVNWMSAFCSFTEVVVKIVDFVFVNSCKDVVNVT